MKAANASAVSIVLHLFPAAKSKKSRNLDFTCPDLTGRAYVQKLQLQSGLYSILECTSRDKELHRWLKKSANIRMPGECPGRSYDSDTSWLASQAHCRRARCTFSDNSHSPGKDKASSGRTHWRTHWISEQQTTTRGVRRHRWMSTWHLQVHAWTTWKWKQPPCPQRLARHRT